MSHSVLSFAGKSIVVVAGLVFGLKQGLGQTETLAGGGVDTGKPAPRVSDPRVETILSRLGEVEKIVGGQWVSSQDLSSAMSRSRLEILKEVDERFEIQKLSLGTLQAMIAQTEHMLERVLEHLEKKDDASDDYEFPEEDDLSLNDLRAERNLKETLLTPKP